MVVILMMSEKFVTQSLFKLNIFLRKVYHIIISVYDVPKKILSRDSDFIIDVFTFDPSLVTLAFLWEKLS